MTPDEEIAATEQHAEQERRRDAQIKISNFHNFVDAVRGLIPGHPPNLGISEEALWQTVRLLEAHLTALGRDRTPVE